MHREPSAKPPFATIAIASGAFLVGALIAWRDTSGRLLLAGGVVIVTMVAVSFVRLTERSRSARRSEARVRETLQTVDREHRHLFTQIRKTATDTTGCIIRATDELAANPAVASAAADQLTAIHVAAKDLTRDIARLTTRQTPTEVSATSVPLHDVVVEIAQSHPQAHRLVFDLKPAIARGDVHHVSDILRTLISLATYDGGTQRTLQTQSHASTVSMTVLGDDPVIPRSALPALDDGVQRRPDDPMFESLQAAAALAKRMGGHITVKSAFGAGYTTLTLPAAGPTAD